MPGRSADAFRRSHGRRVVHACGIDFDLPAVSHRSDRRGSAWALALLLAALGLGIAPPAIADRLSFVCDVRYPDGKTDQTTIEIDTSIPSIDGKTDGEVEDFDGPCTYKVSVTASAFSWARNCKTADGKSSRSDSFSIDRLTGYYSELSSVGGESHVFRASGTCTKQRSTKPPL
ncbi:MAG TPA: hypothetical protein VKE73_10320 [Myxococcota bacterium]|nr:hypothetical protein [Myxococcota bacterium]